MPENSSVKFVFSNNLRDVNNVDVPAVRIEGREGKGGGGERGKEGGGGGE